MIVALFFMISCNTKEQPNSAINNIKTASISLDTTPKGNLFGYKPLSFSEQERIKVDYANQIGEYVREVFQDSKGNIWFGTLARGVARYDLSAEQAGEKSLVYFSTEDGLAGNQVNQIAEDKDGNIWFVTTNGVSKYNGNSFTNFNEDNGLCDNRTWSILIDKAENIWVGTVGGVCRYDGKSFSRFSLPESDMKNTSSRFSTDLAWEIIEDSKGNIWFGTDGVGAYKYDGKSFTHFTKKDGLCNNNITGILEDTKGNIWFGSKTTRVPEKDKSYSFVDSKDAGLARYDGKSFTRFPTILGLSKKTIGLIYEDTAGNIWIVSKHYGVFKYDGQQFINYQENQGYTNNCIQSILEDKDGTMWFGFSGGLFRFNGMNFVNIPKDYFKH